MQYCLLSWNLLPPYYRAQITYLPCTPYYALEYHGMLKGAVIRKVSMFSKCLRYSKSGFSRVKCLFFWPPKMARTHIKQPIERDSNGN